MSDWDVESVKPLTAKKDDEWAVVDHKREPSAYGKYTAEQLKSFSPEKRELIHRTHMDEPEAPKWDILGDIGRTAKGAVATMGQAFPSPQELKTQEAANNSKYGPVLGEAKSAMLDPLASSAKLPLGALALLVGSPITGALHALAGSALGSLPGMNKQLGDEAVDQGMMGIAPGREGLSMSQTANYNALRAPAQSAVKPVMAAMSDEEKAIAAIRKRFDEDAKAGGMSAVDAIKAVKESEKPMTLADFGGENVQALAGKMAREPGASRTVIKTFLDKRDADAGTRIEADIDQHLGQGSARQTYKALAKSRSEAADADYTQAYGANKNMDSPELQRIITTPAGVEAMQKAIVKMKNSRKSAGKVDPELTALVKELVETGKMPETGSRGIANGLKLETWDYVKRSLDDQWLAAKKAGNVDDARILGDLRHDFVGELDRLDVTAKAGPNSVKPEGGKYRQARRKFAGTSQTLDALESGKDFFNPRVSPEEIAETFNEMNPGDREFYKLGVADEARARVARTGVTGDDSKAIAKDPWMSRKLEIITGGPEGASSFLKALGDERTMFDTKYRTVGNSMSAGRIAEDSNKDVEHLARGAGAMAKLMSGRPVGALWDAWKLSRDLGKMNNPAVNENIARLLTSTTLDPDTAIGQKLMGNTTARSVSLSNFLQSRLAGLRGRQQAGPSVGQGALPIIGGQNALQRMLAPPGAMPPTPQQQPQPGQQ